MCRGATAARLEGDKLCHQSELQGMSSTSGSWFGADHKSPCTRTSCWEGTSACRQGHCPKMSQVDTGMGKSQGVPVGSHGVGSSCVYF